MSNLNRYDINICTPSLYRFNIIENHLKQIEIIKSTRK